MILAESFEVPGATRFRAHEHPDVHVCVVLAGGFVERDGKSWRDVGAGTLRVSGGARHDIDFSPNGATCLVLEAELDSGLPPTAPAFLENDTRLMSLAHEIETTTRSTNPADEILRSDLLTELFAQIHRRITGRPQSSPAWLPRVRAIIHDTAGAASMTDLAREAGVHRVHVARMFRDHYGLSVRRYSKHVRVRKALQLLTDAPIPLSELALTAGYADQSHLTRDLRSAIGETPAALRSRLHPFKT
jgi:AraC family transcriptional regulator